MMRCLAALLAAGCAPSETATTADSVPMPPTRDAGTALAACVAPPRDAWTPAAVGAARFVVNRATRGMASQVFWTLSPDSSALLVVDDPAGVENEAVPDGALHANERTGRVWRMDSVWAVSPSPDWRRIAAGRAVVLQGGAEQRVDPARWTPAAAGLARLAGPHPALVADSLRAHAFPASGMAVAEGAAATFVVEVGADVAAPPLRFVSLGGWRVSWSCDGADLRVADRPRMVQDDSPPRAERRVGTGAAPSGAQWADSVRWATGPTLDISVALPRAAVAPLHARGRSVEMRDGQVVVRDGAGGAARIVGPGIPLAATRGARFILAIAPRQEARPHESPDEAVVYRVP